MVLGVGVSLGVLVSQTALADKSAALKRAEAAAAQVDFSDSIHNSSDRQSRSLFLGDKPLTHHFEVSKQGHYRIAVGGFPGETGAYDLHAELKNDNGVVLEQADGSERTNGVAMSEDLAPGKYAVTITGRSRGPARNGHQSVTVRVMNLDRQEGLGDQNRVERLAPAGATTAEDERRQASNPPRLAPQATTAGVGASQRSASEVTSPSPLPDAPGPSGQALEQAVAESSTPDRDAGAAASATDRNHNRQAEAPATAESNDATPMRHRLLRDVSIREKGDVLKFEVMQAGDVVVESSSFGATQGSYRLSAEVINADGQVVASDSGEGLDGDFHIRKQLEPGVYTVRVSGQKYGSARSGTDSYTLRVEQE
ncbi:hypothetical protein [Kushneria phosphatilytica]|uniref:hypothetical protein n=1 Tax=Kushneria phosphatilytica TaxID=657387 RepID=UPI0008D9E1B1|nr:hypothetical protein [Kushneria phosphatilytica]OHV09923.1 hypothetical protein BH688_09860 [Kushneria phosphatilytica]